MAQFALQDDLNRVVGRDCVLPHTSTVCEYDITTYSYDDLDGLRVYLRTKPLDDLAIDWFIEDRSHDVIDAYSSTVLHGESIPRWGALKNTKDPLLRCVLQLVSELTAESSDARTALGL